MLGLHVDSWRGPERLARDLPVTSWQVSEKWPAMPSLVLTAGFPADMWPRVASDPLMPMGQTLRCEVVHGGRTVPLPPFRVGSVGEGVEVEADSIDLSISEDPWAYPSSPRSGASLLQEATRLADPVPVRLGVPDVTLPAGLAWSGDRHEALLELAASRASRWQLEADGSLLLVPLGNLHEPDRVYGAREIVAASRALSRDRVSKATVVVEGDDETEARVVVKRLTQPEFAPEVYGTVGRVETLKSGATQAQIDEAADAALAEGGVEREFQITIDPTLRAGMTVRLDIERPDGPETVNGRVTSHSFDHTGSHAVTVMEAL